MLNEMELFKFGLLAERAHRLGLDIALQASSLGEKSIGIIADEARNIGEKLYRVFDRTKANQLQNFDIEEEIVQLECLTTNGCIEMLRIGNYANHHTLTLAVIFDEMMNLANDLKKLLQYKTELPQIIPNVFPRNPAVDISIKCIIMTIGGIDFCENIQYVAEIIRYNADNICGDILSVRGHKIPIIDCYDKLSLEKPTETKMLVIINTDYAEQGRTFAIPVDTLPTVFKSDIGVSTNIYEQPMQKYIRECWNCEENRKILFLDYLKII